MACSRVFREARSRVPCWAPCSSRSTAENSILCCVCVSVMHTHVHARARILAGGRLACGGACGAGPPSAHIDMALAGAVVKTYAKHALGEWCMRCRRTMQSQVRTAMEVHARPCLRVRTHTHTRGYTRTRTDTPAPRAGAKQAPPAPQTPFAPPACLPPSSRNTSVPAPTTPGHWVGSSLCSAPRPSGTCTPPPLSRLARRPCPWIPAAADRGPGRGRPPPALVLCHQLDDDTAAAVGHARHTHLVTRQLQLLRVRAALVGEDGHMDA